ncbi:MAG: tRNA (adenosine(37)-N6)-threonylcarbamoyltransferase complex dimerization subunit type 1 TsaB [Pseudomonadota bacterium]
MGKTDFPQERAKWPKVLAFDTSGPFVSVSWSFNSYAGETRHEMARGQAEALIPQAEQALHAHGWDWADLDALAVGVGPGNFTGIRIGVSAARGLALALNVPVFGIDAFQAAYGHYKPPPGTLISLRAPRDMAYVQGYGTGSAPQFGSGRLINPAEPPRDLQLSFGMEVYGFEARKIADQFEAIGNDGFERGNKLNQAEMAELLYQEARVFPPPPAPQYIRAPDAAPARDDGLRLL